MIIDPRESVMINPMPTPEQLLELREAAKKQGGVIVGDVYPGTMGFEKLRTTGDINSDEKGSGARYDAGKVPYELIPTHLLESTALVFGYGAKKYAAWNWAKGMPWTKVIGCMKRHLAAIERGEDIDPESGLPHIGHLMCNALMLEHYMSTYKEGDDRPTKWFAKPE